MDTVRFTIEGRVKGIIKSIQPNAIQVIFKNIEKVFEILENRNFENGIPSVCPYGNEQIDL